MAALHLEKASETTNRTPVAVGFLALGLVVGMFATQQIASQPGVSKLDAPLPGRE